MSRKLLPALSLTLILTLSYLAIGQNEAPPATPTTPAPQPPANTITFNNLKEKVSYAVGLNLGAQFKQEYMTVDPAMIARGIADIQDGRPPALTADEIKETVIAYREELLAQSAQRNQQFLEANKLREGVKTLPSGLQYEVLEEGEGDASPSPTDTFVAHYRGMLIDGRVFDSSYDKGRPLEYTVEDMIPGWVEALQKMKRGSKWRLIVPPSLAYGQTPPPRSIIPPDAILVFEMELLDFRPADPESNEEPSIEIIPEP